jgi:hypothetical protein
MLPEQDFGGEADDLGRLAPVLAAVTDGWPVLPLAPGTKRPPKGSLGAYAATTDPAEVERVWSVTPDANIGGAAGRGFIALDVDPDEGAAETLAELPELPRTRTHQTPGGEHLVYRAPPGTRGAKLGDGVTVRGLGSYIVLPGSVLADGGEYLVLDDHHPVDAPDWLLERLANHTPEDVDLPAELEVDLEVLPRHLRAIIAEVPGVDRSGQVYNLVAAALEWGLEDGEVLFLGRRFTPAAEKYSERLELELGRAIAKGRARHQHPGQPCDRAGCPSTPTWMGGPPIPEADFWSSRPVLTRVRDFALARRASPWATLGVVLARVVVATPPTVTLPALIGGPASLNLLAGLVGPPGTGKGAAEATAPEVVDVGHIDVAGIGSGEGIAHLFARRVKPKGQPSYVERYRWEVLLDVPEVDTLRALHTRQSSTLFAELRKASMGERLGFSYADQDKTLPIEPHSYRLALVVGIQPKRAGVLFEDADAGTPQRFVWLPTTNPTAPDLRPQEPAPWSWSPAFLVDVRGPLPVCPVACDYIDSTYLARHRSEAHALDAHSALTRLKVAAALALLDERAEVAERDWRLAGVVMGVSDRTRAGVVEALAASTRERNRARGEAEADRAIVVESKTRAAAVERLAGVLVRRLRRARGDWVARAELRKAVAGRDREHFEAALDSLLDAKSVISDEAERDQSGHGGEGARYRLAKGP